MKTISSLAAIFVIAFFASPVIADTQVPLNGSFAAVEIDDVQFPFLYVSGSATGNATQLGRYTATFQETVELFGATSVGAITLVAANGDNVFATQTGIGIPTSDPDVFTITEVNTITGGTGRFAGATGTFTIERVVDLTTGLSSGSFTGMISSRGNH